MIARIVTEVGLGRGRGVPSGQDRVLSLAASARPTATLFALLAAVG